MHYPLHIQLLRSRYMVLVLLSCFFSVNVFSQDTAVINFKQRFLRASKQNKEEIETADSFRILHLMIAGNVYQTEKHVSYCFDEAGNKYNFKDELKYVQPLLGLGDVTIANLRTSFGGDVKNMFSAPDEFALQLKYSGINAVMHANLHTANVSKQTLKRTRQLLNSYDMFHTGSFTDNNQRGGNYPLIINKKGFRIAILNYTSLLTRPAISRDFIINEFDKTTIERDLRMARANQPDFIIVYFDWGNKEQTVPSAQQIDLAQFVFQRGASIVVGTNPNAPMRIDMINYMDNGQWREGIAAYSLGNLIASNDEVANRNGFLLDIELKKNNYTHSVGVNDWGVIPVYTHYDTTMVKGQVKVFSVPCWAVENGEVLPKIPYIEKRRTANSAYEIRKLVGAVADEIQYNLNELIVNNVQETIDITNAPINNKFSIAREEDVEPTDPPVLPVATIGSNNPPSLAVLYEDPTKNTYANGAKPLIIEPNLSPEVIAARKEAQRTNNISLILAATTASAIAADMVKIRKPAVITQENTKAKNQDTAVETRATATTENKNNTAIKTENATSAQTDSPATSEKTATNVVAVNAVAKNSTTETIAPVSPSETKKSVVTAEEKATAKQVETNATNTTRNNQETSANQTAYTEKEKLKQTQTTTTTENPKTVSQGTTINDEEERRKKAGNYDYYTTQTKNQTVNTNYRTTGKDYEVATPAYADRTKPKQTTTSVSREKETGISVASSNTTGITTDINGGIKPDLVPLKEVNMKVVVDTFYRIQFYALKKFIPLDTNYYTHLKGYEVREEEGLFKYLLGKFKNYEDCEKLWKGQIQPRYKQSFIIKYVDGKRILE